jgi:hypothetical protein
MRFFRPIFVPYSRIFRRELNEFRAPPASKGLLNVWYVCSINSDEHDAEHGVRSGPEQQALQRARERKGCVIVCLINREKQRGDAKRAGVK